MVPSRICFDMIEKRWIFTTQSLKRVLRGLCVLHCVIFNIIGRGIRVNLT
jgi:hypothetical protein